MIHLETVWTILELPTPDSAIGNQVWTYTAIGANGDNLYEVQIPPMVLNRGTLYQFQMYYNYLDDNGDYQTTPVYVVNAETPLIADPVITLENENISNPVQSFIPTGPTIDGGRFETLVGADTHMYSDWSIVDTANNTVWESLNDTVNLTTIDVPDGTLQPGTNYIVGVCYYGKSDTIGSCMSKAFRTYEPVIIQTPTITTDDQPDGVHRLAVFTGSPFTPLHPDNTPFPNGDIHLSTRWILTNVDTGNVLIDYTTSVPSQMTQLDMAQWEAIGVVLDPGTNYSITAEYIGVLASATGQLLFNTPLVDPIVLNVQGAPDGIYRQPTINTDPFNVSFGSDVLLSATWRITEVSTGNVVYETVNDPVNLTSIPSPTLTQGTLYRVEVEWFTRSGFDLSTFLVGSTPVLGAPTLTVEGQADAVPPEPILTSSAFSVSQGTDTHDLSYWEIQESDGAGGWNTVWSSGPAGTNLLNIQATDPTDNVVVTPMTDYRAVVTHYGVTGFSVSSAYNYFTGVTPVVTAPTVSAPCFPNNTDILPTFTVSPYTSTYQFVNTYQYTLLEVYALNPDGTLGNLIESSGQIPTDPATWTMTTQLDYNTDYAIVATHVGLYTSAQSTTTFTTVQLGADGFVVVEPTTGGVINTPGTDIVLQDGSGQVYNLFNHTATDWQVVETATGVVAWESLNDTVNLTSISLPDGTLSPGVDYTIRVRIYMDGCPSGWTETLYTLPAIQPPVVQDIYYDIQGPTTNTNVIMELSPFTMISGTDTFNRTEVSVFDVTNNVDLGVIPLNYDNDMGTYREINITLPNFDNDYLFSITYYGNSGSYSVPPTQQAFRTAPQYALAPISITVEGAPKSVPDDPLINITTAIPTGVTNTGPITSSLTIMRRFYDANDPTTIGTDVDYFATTPGEFTTLQLNPGDLQIGCHPTNNFNGNDTHYATVNVTTAHATVNSLYHYFTVARIVQPTLTLPGGSSNVSLATDITVVGTTLGTEPLTCGGTETHLSTNWSVVDSASNVVYTLTGTAAAGTLTTFDIPVSVLNLGETYTVTAEYVGQYQTSQAGTTSFSTQALPAFSTPNLTVSGAPSNLSNTPTMSIDPVTIVPAGSDTHVSTTWTVRDDATGNVVYQATTTGTELLTHTIPAGSALPNGQYTFSAIANGNLNSSAEATVGPYTVGNIDTPTVAVEGAPNNVPNGPLLTLSPYSGSGNFTTMDIEVRDTANPTTIYYSANGVPGATSYQVPAGYMPANTQMDFRVRYYNDQGAVSAWGSATATTANYAPTIAPTITVQDEPNAGAPPGAIVSYTGFQVAWVNSSTYVDTTITVRYFNNGSLGATVYSANGVNAPNGGSFTVPEANLLAADYKVFIRHNGSAGGDPTAEHVFTWHKIATPSITSPTNNTTLPSNELTVNATPFTVNPANPNITHQSTDWYLRDTATGTVVWQSVGDTTNLTSVTVPSGTLQYNKTYAMAVRYNGTNGNSTISSDLYNDPANGTVWSVTTPPGVFSDPDFIFTGSPDILTKRFVIHYRPFTDTPANTFGSVFAKLEIIEEDTGNVLVTKYTVLDRVNTTTYNYNNIYTITTPGTNYIVRVTYQSTVNGITYYGPTVNVPVATSRAPSTWTFIANKNPSPKGGAGYCALLDGRFVFGMGATRANTTSGRTSACYIADKEFNTITPIANAPLALQGPAWAPVDYYRFISVGGRTNNTNSRPRAFIYDIRTNAWSNLPNMPASRYAPACVTLPNGEILVVGGAYWSTTTNSYNFSSQVFSFNFDANVWVSRTNAPFRAAHHRIILTKDNRVLIIVTRRWDTVTNSEVTANDIYEYDWYSEFELGVTDPNVLYTKLDDLGFGTTNDTNVYYRLGIAELYSGRIARSFGNGGAVWDIDMAEWSAQDYSGQSRYMGDWFADYRNRVFTINQNSNTNWASTINNTLGIYRTEDCEDILIKTIGDGGIEDPAGSFRIIAENTSGIAYDTISYRAEDDYGTSFLTPGTISETYTGGVLETSFNTLALSNTFTGPTYPLYLKARFEDSTGVNPPSRWYRKKIHSQTDLGKPGAEVTFTLPFPASEILIARSSIRVSKTKVIMPLYRGVNGNNESGMLVFDETTQTASYTNATSVVSSAWFQPLDGPSMMTDGLGRVYGWRMGFLGPSNEFYLLNSNNNTVTRLNDLPFTQTYTSDGVMLSPTEFLVAVGECVDVVGNSYINTIWKYDTNSDTWTRMNDFLPQGGNSYRISNLSIDRHGRIVLWAYWSNTQLPYNTDVFCGIYDTTNDTWERADMSFRNIYGGSTSDAPPDAKGSYDYNNVYVRASFTNNNGFIRTSLAAAYVSPDRRLADSKLMAATRANYVFETDVPTSNYSTPYGYLLTEHLPDGTMRVWNKSGYLEIQGFRQRSPYMP